MPESEKLLMGGRMGNYVDSMISLKEKIISENEVYRKKSSDSKYPDKIPLWLKSRWHAVWATSERTQNQIDALNNTLNNFTNAKQVIGYLNVEMDRL